ncbi:MAG: hypothetical protein ACYS6W_14660, partial [Planctomycetota bacterium]
PPKDIEEAVRKIKQSAPIVYCYEPNGNLLRHPNNFVFFHDYCSLFGEFELAYCNCYPIRNVARGFVWTT